MYGLYAATVFVGAVLVFSVQPLLGKMFLPVMGGTSAVWNTAMVFFQFMLLAGYLYAHLSTRWLGPRRQWQLHLAVLLIGFAFLPIAIGTTTDSALAAYPAAWVLITLLLAAGWPFLVVSSTAPLLQRWLAASDHPAARDPYPLYAASNTGSVLALLAYPFILEPWLGLGKQSSAWLWGYGLLALLISACALWLQRRPGAAPSDSQPAPAPDWRARGQWLLWAFIPSSLLLAVTTVITTDLAAMPLLWVIPLALYLLSHIHAFARHRLIATRWLLGAIPLLAVPTAFILAIDLAQPLTPLIVLHLATLSLLALAFHGMLADSRPAPRHLTEFYVWLALGGAAGGVFTALLAPLLFDRLLEYPIVLALAVVAIPARLWQQRVPRLSLLTGFAIAITLATVMSAFTDFNVWPFLLAAAALTAAILTARFAGPRVSRGIAVAASLAAVLLSWQGGSNELLAERSFYGTHRVLAEQGGDFHVLMHGNTSHGVQHRVQRYRNVPLAYYHPDGPLGDVFAAAGEKSAPGDVAVVGLGSGSIATYRRPYQRMVFFEIDPLVARLALRPELFSYLSDCGRGCSVRIGDGRLQLAREPAGRFQLLVIDAYSSAAIPLHLLTREALEIFLAALDADGLIAVHVSNRYVQLAPIIARLGAELGLSVRRHQHWSGDGRHHQAWIHDSEWVVLARSPAALGPLAKHADWNEVAPAAGASWTDDYAPVWRAYFN